MNYVAGFLFDKKGYVALIEKQKPAWQKGRLNAIGGKIEIDELPIEAMRREFQEETGATVNDWRHYVSLNGEGSLVYFYYSLVEEIPDLKTTTDERVLVVPISGVRHYPRIANVDWLIPMALSMENDKADSFEVFEKAA